MTLFFSQCQSWRNPLSWNQHVSERLWRHTHVSSFSNRWSKDLVVIISLSCNCFYKIFTLIFLNAVALWELGGIQPLPLFEEKTIWRLRHQGYRIHIDFRFQKNGAELRIIPLLKAVWWHESMANCSFAHHFPYTSRIWSSRLSCRSWQHAPPRLVSTTSEAWWLILIAL